MSRVRPVLVVIIALAQLIASAQSRPAPQSPPQQPVPTFRAGVRAIQVDAVVTDEDGNPVTGLTPDDFEIAEKGQPRPITTFEAVDLPFERQLPDLADSDVVANEGDGRIYLIVFDAISAVNAMYAKRVLRTFFDEYFSPGDVAAVMVLDRAHATAGQDFTSNRRLLIKGIDAFVGYGANESEGVAPGTASPLLVGRPTAPNGVIHFEAPLPLANAAPGRYVLTVEARDGKETDPVTRSIPLRVQ